jgi:SAP domain-containing new25
MNVPRITVGGGASSALGAELPAPEPGAQDVPEDQAAPEPEMLPELEDDDEGPADYSAYPKTVLADLCRERGLPPSGTKAELAGRLAAYDAERESA